MTLVVLLLVPLIAAALLAWGPARTARNLHATTLAAMLGAVLLVIADVTRDGAVIALDGLLRADPLSAWMVGLIAVVATLAGAEALAPGHGNVDGEAMRRFYALFHLFVFTMLLAVTTDDLGLMWVAVEGTTLASVFLVNFHRTRASLEAAYKYLLICSVGIALAFIGTVLVYFADVQQFGAEAHALRWTTLLRWAPQLPPRVVELAFVFLLVGYGTKAGLAPMHTWLPDAHSEAPAPISALMLERSELRVAPHEAREPPHRRRLKPRARRPGAGRLEHLHRLGKARHRHRAKRPRREIALGEAMRLPADEDGPGPRELFHGISLRPTRFGARSRIPAWVPVYLEY